MKRIAEHMLVLSSNETQIIDKDNLLKWKNTLNQYSKDITIRDKQRLVIETSLEEIKRSYVNNINAGNTTTEPSELISKVKENVELQLSNINVDRSETYKKVYNIISKIKDDDDDDDIVLVDRGLTEVDFICPVTRGRMENPIKHKQCGHRMSAAGFQVLKQGAHNAEEVAEITLKNVKDRMGIHQW